MDSDKAQRMGFTISPRTKRALEMLADERQVSAAWVIKMLIGRGLALEGIVAEGGKIVARHPDGSEEVLLDNRHDYLRPRLELRDD